jgi:hypothetical protein
MNIVRSVVSFVHLKVTEIRLKGHAKENAYHGIQGQAAQVLAAVHGTPAGGPVDLIADETPPDTTSAQATVNDLGEQLAPYAWYPLIPILLVFFAFIGWRGSTRLFLASGFPPTDAMLLGVMLESFNVFLVWLLHQAMAAPVRRHEQAHGAPHAAHDHLPAPDWLHGRASSRPGRPERTDSSSLGQRRVDRRERRRAGLCDRNSCAYRVPDRAAPLPS